MLQLKRNSSGFELTDKTASVQLVGKDVKLADQTFNEPGEYESNGVELVYGELACLIVWEHLQLVYVFSTETPGVFEKEQFSSSDVMIIGEGLPELNRTAFDAMLKNYDPKVVIISSSVVIEDSLKSSLKLQENPAVKLAVTNLPEEGREFYVV